MHHSKATAGLPDFSLFLCAQLREYWRSIKHFFLMNLPGYIALASGLHYVWRHVNRRMGAKMLKTIAAALFASCLFQPTSWARDVRCSGLGDIPNEQGVPLARERIIRVSEPQQLAALGLLGSDTFSALAQSQVDQLLAPDRRPSSESLLSHQAAAADDKAAQCRELAKIPFFAPQSDGMLKTAVAYDAYAAYTRSLPKNLHHYLVKSTVLFEGTGAYSAFLKDHRLSLYHGSLGRGPKDPTNVAVVVFVEAELDQVDISYGGAE